MGKKTIFFLAFILFIVINISGQSQLFQNKEYKYYIGNSDPDKSWSQKNFDDSNWLNGKGPIGYGDNDDTTVINSVPSAYIRYKIDLGDNIKYDPGFLDRLKSMVIYLDFDDGFIAYLNGKEILRVNINDTIHTNSSTLTNRSHEAEMYRYNNTKFWTYTPVLGFNIDSTTLKNCSLGESNILAIEIHNDSINGSDMTLSFDYRFVDNTTQYTYIEETGRYLSIENIDSTMLPIINLELDEYGSDTFSKIASMKIINSGKYNKPLDTTFEFDGKVLLKRHGASSLRFPKRTYKIELQDSLGNNLNQSLLGMPKDNDWLLVGLFADQSLISNELTFTLGRKSGHYEPRSKFCQLIVNGIPQGIYALFEQIKRDKNRVDVPKLDLNDNFGIQVTGGYIFRIDDNEVANDVDVVYPKPDDISIQQKDYILRYYSKFKNALSDKNFLDPETGYKNYIDINSLADYMIFNELALVADGYMKSVYMYKYRDDIDNQIKFGPLWDYDNSYGGGLWTRSVSTGWNFESQTGKLALNKIKLDTVFTKLLANKWFKYRDNFLQLDSINYTIDSLLSLVEKDRYLNYKIWPFDIHSMEIHLANDSSYTTEIKRVKKWIADRTMWMDKNLKGYLNPVKTNFSYHTVDTYVGCYPNPFCNRLNVILNKNYYSEVGFKLVDITGRVCLDKNIDNTNAGLQKFSLEFNNDINSGVYLFKTYINNQCVNTQRVICIK
jgi:hypothetical protein